MHAHVEGVVGVVGTDAGRLRLRVERRVVPEQQLDRTDLALAARVVERRVALDVLRARARTNLRCRGRAHWNLRHTRHAHATHTPRTRRAHATRTPRARLQQEGEHDVLAHADGRDEQCLAPAFDVV